MSGTQQNIKQEMVANLVGSEQPTHANNSIMHEVEKNKPKSKVKETWEAKLLSKLFSQPYPT